MKKHNLIVRIIFYNFNLKVFKLNIFYSKKGISPIVATSLLLVVAVLAVVGFQNWFQFYSSSTFTNIESENIGNSFLIDTFLGGNMYFLNSANIISVKVNGNDCFVSGVTDDGLNTIPISNCLERGDNNIVVVTTNGVFSKRIYEKNYVYNYPCPDGYIIVPGNIELGTKNFCVMKYEAKNDGGVAVSTASGALYVSVTWQEAQDECEVLGSKYHLITENEWLTIAQNVANHAVNWNSSVVGSGFMYLGHNDNDPSTSLLADTDDLNGYYGTNDGVSFPGDGSYFNFPSNDARAYQGQKRTLSLSNGEVIWDLSGNVMELLNNSMPIGLRYYGGGEGWYSYNSDDGTGSVASLVPVLKQPLNGWNALNGMGRYFDGNNDVGTVNNRVESPDFCAGYCSSTAIFLRGGRWSYGEYTGVYALELFTGPSRAQTDTGFRCTYHP